MPYSSLSALVARVGEDVMLQLADRATPQVGVIDNAVVGAALAAADAVVDASLAVRYRLPLVSVPPVVADLATSIALYKLHRFAPDDKVKDDYEQALRDLRDIADGRKRLDVAGLEPETSGASGVIASDRPRDLTPENLSGFI